jgi:uncharacterized protein YbjT (DUF2867 family)
MRTNKSIAVIGATGHTGGFVIKELLTRGWTPLLVGRDAARLASIARLYPGGEPRLATIEDASALERAVTGTTNHMDCASFRV